MPQQEDLPPISGDLKALEREIKEAIDEIEAITDRRSNVAADKAEVVKRLEKRGINRHAFRLAMQYAAMGEHAQQNFDVAYALVRKASGKPMQHSFVFDSAKEPKVAAVS